MDIEKTKEKLESGEARDQLSERGFGGDKPHKVETKESLDDQKRISDELKREVELMNLDDNLRKMAEIKAAKIKVLADDDKLENLLKFAREHGVVGAVKIAKSMNDPFLLDTFHDLLAKEGLYKSFIKEKS